MQATTPTLFEKAPTREAATTAASAPSPLAPLMLAIIGVGVLHMGEQILFGIEEFYMLRDGVARWYGLFPADWADHASVLLITIVVTALSLAFYALVRSPGAARWVVGVFGVLGVTEAHHWFDAMAKGAYDPGLVTSVAYVGVGAWMLRRLWRERGVSGR